MDVFNRLGGCGVDVVDGLRGSGRWTCFSAPEQRDDEKNADVLGHEIVLSLKGVVGSPSTIVMPLECEF
jgi:hypothetical protein